MLIEINNWITFIYGWNTYWSLGTIKFNQFIWDRQYIIIQSLSSIIYSSRKRTNHNILSVEMYISISTIYYHMSEESENKNKQQFNYIPQFFINNPIWNLPVINNRTHYLQQNTIFINLVIRDVIARTITKDKH